MLRKLALAAILALAASAACAHEYNVGTLEIVHPWTRATPKGAPVAGGYLKITNNGRTAERLLSASSLSAPRVEIHEMTLSGGTMRMRPLPKGLEIKPGETVELKPGSFHIMFMNLTQSLEQGQRIKGTLIFEKAGPVEIEFAVEAPVGANAPGHRH
jgi:periplasmic copper chaperone A